MKKNQSILLFSVLLTICSRANQDASGQNMSSFFPSTNLEKPSEQKSKTKPLSNRKSLVERMAISEPKKKQRPDDLLRNESEVADLLRENSKLEMEIQRLLSPEKTNLEETPPEPFLPPFPLTAKINNSGSAFYGAVNFQTAAYGFDDDRNVTNLSNVVLGKNLQIQDLILISKLARLGSKQDTSGNWTYADVVTGTGNTVVNKKYLIGDTSLGATSQNIEDIFFPATGTTSSTALESLSQAIQKAINLDMPNHWINRLADKQMLFKCDYKRIWADLFYYTNIDPQNNWTLVIGTPIVFQSNKTELVSELTPQETADLQSDLATGSLPKFFVSYPGGISDLYKAFLKRQGLEYEPRSNQFGIGDTVIYLNRNFYVADICSKAIMGIGLTIPSGTRINNRQVWPATLGNGGFWEIRAQAGLYTDLFDWYCPHLFAECEFSIPSKVERRIAKLVSRQGKTFYTTDNERAADFAMGEEFLFSTQYKWTLPETTTSVFAKHPLQSLEINRGTEFKFEAGSLFRGILIPNFAVDLTYRYSYKNADNAGFRSRDANYDTKNLFAKSENYSHTILVQAILKYSDQIDASLRLSQVLLGKNTPRAFDLRFALSYKF